MMPLNKVTDMSFQRSFPGRLMGYGEFIVESAGQNQALDRVGLFRIPSSFTCWFVGCSSKTVHPTMTTSVALGPRQ